MNEDLLVKKEDGRGGAREGSGRRKGAPDGAKQTSFVLSDEEREIVKEYIDNMRRERSGKAVRNLAKEEALKEALLKYNTMILKELIYLGGGSECFAGFEKFAKTMAIMAFKDAVAQYENEIELRSMKIEAEKRRLPDLTLAQKLPK